MTNRLTPLVRCPTTKEGTTDQKKKKLISQSLIQPKLFPPGSPLIIAQKH
jgi:hypothetical protein